MTSEKPKSVTAAKQHLLFVDDEEDLRRTLRRYFMKHGYRITTAASGEEALKLLDEEVVHLIIIDLLMPKMSGMELLARVRKEHPSLPTVIFTGMGFDESLLLQARAIGASGFVSKGLPLASLLMEMHRLLNYP
jgi:two-component system response regulator AtoC